MGDFSKKRAQAAGWMFKRKDRPVLWWRWFVLTKHNPDPETLGLDDLTAFLIFSDFVHDGLLVPIIASDGKEAYSINPGKENDWLRAMSPVRYWLNHNIWKSFFWLFSNLGAGVIGVFVGILWDKITKK